MSNKIFIQPLEENFDEFLKYANKHGYNLEIASFALGDALDANWKVLVKKYKNSLKNFSGNISIHGVFRDIILNSGDKKLEKPLKKEFITI